MASKVYTFGAISFQEKFLLKQEIPILQHGREESLDRYSKQYRL